jgi:hypothetical protein
MFLKNVGTDFEVMNGHDIEKKEVNIYSMLGLYYIIQCFFEIVVL